MKLRQAGYGLSTPKTGRCSVVRAHSSAAVEDLGPACVVIGGAGGVGATTIARLLGPLAGDAGRPLPEPDERPLVIVARGTAAGLQGATALLTSASRIGHHRPAVVIVADGPYRLPAQAKARLRMLDDPSRVRACVLVPYVIAWRDLDDPLTDSEPNRALNKAVRRLSLALQAPAPLHPPVAPSGAPETTA